MNVIEILEWATVDSNEFVGMGYFHSNSIFRF